MKSNSSSHEQCQSFSRGRFGIRKNADLTAVGNARTNDVMNVCPLILGRIEFVICCPSKAWRSLFPPSCKYRFCPLRAIATNPRSIVLTLVWFNKSLTLLKHHPSLPCKACIKVNLHMIDTDASLNSPLNTPCKEINEWRRWSYDLSDPSMLTPLDAL